MRLTYNKHIISIVLIAALTAILLGNSIVVGAPISKYEPQIIAGSQIYDDDYSWEVGGSSNRIIRGQTFLILTITQQIFVTL